jgi:predicted component of type VI protein secretion system
MSQIPVQRTVFDKEKFTKVVDVNFNQLLNSQSLEENPSFTIDDFFQLYEDLFDQIPREGDINSHQYILQREAEYLGVQISQDDLQALLNEITDLRQELLDSQKIINDLTNSTNTTI